MRLIVAVVAALSLVAGFAIAQATGVRALGGVVLVVGGLWCAIQLWRAVGWARTTLVGVAYAAAFVASHPLGRVIGPWVAVVTVSVLVGGLAWMLGDRRSVQ